MAASPAPPPPPAPHPTYRPVPEPRSESVSGGVFDGLAKFFIGLPLLFCCGLPMAFGAASGVAALAEGAWAFLTENVLLLIFLIALVLVIAWVCWVIAMEGKREKPDWE